ncbi:hypothetical protein HYH03_017605 [Edaphochlamys debaryana]|uniref:CCHC-type domain-containing protein n=1 Tax=Edaphochlamys debaryana TaxID=47281 RepID=A0A836BNR5_9CHLO|nr:hypothetical protein HYH03_017605 [Edaphochlamys debaryana]|eukprot:KAG2483551.1 hypothetical protein HYH03_017605 [Edaphochlamys debaryana]
MQLKFQTKYGDAAWPYTEVLQHMMEQEVRVQAELNADAELARAGMQTLQLAAAMPGSAHGNSGAGGSRQGWQGAGSGAGGPQGAGRGRPAKGACFHCGQPGHYKDKCPVLRAERERQKQQQGGQGPPQAGGQQAGGSVSGVPAPGARYRMYAAATSAAQCEALAGRAEIIMDSGSHLPFTYDDNDLYDLRDVAEPTLVQFGQGPVHKAKKEGKMLLLCDVGVAGYAAAAAATTAAAATAAAGSGMQQRAATWPSRRAAAVELAHRRFAHMGTARMLLLPEQLDGLDFTKRDVQEWIDSRGVCEPCALAKLTRAPFHRHPRPPRATEVLQLVHMDAAGPIKPGFDQSNSSASPSESEDEPSSPPAKAGELQGSPAGQLPAAGEASPPEGVEEAGDSDAEQSDGEGAVTSEPGEGAGPGGGTAEPSPWGTLVQPLQTGSKPAAERPYPMRDNRGPPNRYGQEAAGKGKAAAASTKGAEPELPGGDEPSYQQAM